MSCPYFRRTVTKTSFIFGDEWIYECLNKNHPTFQSDIKKYKTQGAIPNSAKICKGDNYSKDCPFYSNKNSNSGIKKESEKVYCSNCGKKVPDGKYCKECGARMN